MANKAAVLKEAKSQLVVEERPVPQTGANELLVKVHAVATNPVDWKMAEYGAFIKSYPIILGSDISGVVEQVGSGVQKFTKGDRVTGFASALVSGHLDHGAFQQYVLVSDSAIAKIPDSVSFEEGAVLPMSVATAGVGIFLFQNIPWPAQKQKGAFLVWGASSSVGTGAVQIAKSLGFTVYGVCSPQHSDYVKSLGAREAFDYNDPSVANKITQTLKASNEPEYLVYDAICAQESSQKCVEILKALGGGKLCTTLQYPEDAEKPDGVQITHTFAARIIMDAKDFGRWLFGEWLTKSLADKSYVPSPAIERVGGGIEAIQKALDLHKKGLSGKKLVVTL